MANRIKLQLALGSSFDAVPAAGASPSPQGSPLNTSQPSVRNARELAESDEPVKGGAL
jgi:hypothetical protein